MWVALTILKQGFVHYHSAQITFQNGRTLKAEFLETPFMQVLSVHDRIGEYTAEACDLYKNTQYKDNL